MINYIKNWCKSIALNALTPKSIGNIGIVKTGFVPVYREIPVQGLWKGVSNITWSTGKSGVYVIKENRKVVYVGKSGTNLYRTIMRHFQKWNDKDKPDRISYADDLGSKDYYVQIILCKQNDIPLYEAALIQYFGTRDNKRDEPIDDIDMESVIRIYNSTVEEVPF